MLLCCIWSRGMECSSFLARGEVCRAYLPQTSAGNREISVLFADLQGFTTFSESHQPDEVTRMLNEYFAVAVPAVKTPYGGEIDRIIGDALMVTFNKRGDQPDHAQRAAGAGLALQKAASRLAKGHPEWPQFRGNQFRTGLGEFAGC